MRLLGRVAVLAGALAALAPRSAPAAAAPGLTPQERAGKRIYHDGIGGHGELRAFLGATPVPAAAVPCASCHGPDGLGRPEGGVVPPPITWAELTARHGHAHPGGRSHPAFDARSAARAVTEGVDPAGNALDPVMPRYSLSRADTESLLAYLRVIDRERDPGVGDRTLRLATVLPTRGRLAESGAAMRRTLEAALERANRSGGIHGRRLVLAVAGFDSDRGGAAAALRDLIARDPPFALVAGLAPGEEEALAALAERERLPLVAPLAQAPEDAAARRYVFYALPGLSDQARALARWSLEGAQGPRRPTAVLHAGDPELEAAATAAAAELRAGGLEPVRVAAVGAAAPIDRALVEGLKRDGVEQVLLLGPDRDLEALATQAEALGFAPRVLAPGALVARAATSSPLAGGVFVAFPSLPSTIRSGALEEIAPLPAGAVAPGRPRVPEVAAATAAAVLSEGLRRAGRTLSRERLVDALEHVFALDTGLVPPLTFGPSRRVGARGAYVLAVDAARHRFEPASGFIRVE